MYRLLTINDTVRVPPKHFGLKLEDSVLQTLREQYENKIDTDLGLILCIHKVNEVGPGKIIPGDGASYHDVVFDVLVFQPKIHEIVMGKVSEITNFGAFVKLGPVDGLVHVSQVTDDFISYNEKTGTLAGKESGKVLKEGDIVRGRIVTISMKPVLTESRIGLTMRQPNLGKLEWIEDAKKKKVKKKPKEVS